MITVRKNQHVPESPRKPPPAAGSELDTDPPDACSLPSTERPLPTRSGTGPAMAIYEEMKRMRKILIKVVEKKTIVCVGVVSVVEYDGNDEVSVMFCGG